ncbi:unnamed protein product [Heterobilharzia americana]|nr:unnamed protein product [Heterobilharzia americana]
MESFGCIDLSTMDTISKEKGQLKAFLNFLNLDSAMVGASGSGHRPARELIRKVREKRQQKVRLFKNEANKSRRLLTKCLNEIKEFSELIEENLTSLSTLLDILVPNQLDENNKGNKNETRSEVQKIGSEYPFSSTKVESTKSVNSLDSLRLHGFLSGSSSGMGLGSTLTIEIHLPCNSQTDSSGFPFGPKILIKRSEETRDIEESAKTYARLADEKHKPKLINWLQTLESIQTVDSSGNLSLKRSEKIKQIQQWIDRVETLTTLFHRGIEFFDNVPENNGNIFVQSSDLQQHDDMFVSSDESDFEDVDGTVHNTVELLCPDKSSPENAIGLRREKSELTAQKNLTNIEDTKAQNLTQKENDRLKLQKTGQVVDNLQSTSSHKSAVSEVKSSHHTVVWRSTESAHRFWKPTDPDEYDTPQEYLESAISFVSKDASQYEVSTAQNHSPIHRTETEQDGIGLPDGVPDVPIGLICWAPLLSGSLCQRHSTSGRCPVHGRIVKRDRATGRPVNIEDRKIIQQEMESTRLTKQKKLDEKRKKDSRKHYPGLMNLSKKATDSHGRLQARVMNKRSLQKLSETLMK